MRIRLPQLVAATGLVVALQGAPTASAQDHRGRTHHVVHHAHHVVHHARTHHTTQGAPPPARVVARPPRPFVGAVWTDGYWRWSGSEYVWVQGAWVHPVPGRRWSPWRWELRDGAWVLIPGGWIRSHEGPL